MSEARNDSVHVRAIAWVGALLVLTIVLAGAAAYWVWTGTLPPPLRDAPNTRLDFHADAPLLDSAPQPNRAAYDAEKQRLLNSWQWLDRQAGVARIPIAQAMQLMAQSGSGKKAQEGRKR